MTTMLSRARSACAFSILAIAINGVRAAEPAPSWPDTPVYRIEALALLESLSADLLSNDSATLTLDRWCSAHRMASPAKVEAIRVRGADKEATPEIRELLNVSSTDPLRYRHVRLHCGDRVLSEADNWYVPARLTPEMNQVLDTTDTAFGRAVQALGFHRRTLSARLLWSPLPQGWEMQNGLPKASKGILPVPPEVIQHRAVLSVPDGTPISVVVETYTNQVLAFPAPPAVPPS